MPDIVVAVGEQPQPVDPTPQPVPQPVPQAGAPDLTGLTADGHAPQPAPFSPESTANAADAVRAVYGDAADMQPQEMIDPEQHLRGVLKSMKDWWRLKLACDMFQGAAKSRRRLPIMMAPLGEEDKILGVEHLEIDWHAPIREAYQAQRHEEVTQYMHTLCLAMNNMYVGEYVEALVTLRERCLSVILAFTGGNEVARIKEGVEYEQLVGAIADQYVKGLPAMQNYLDTCAALEKGDYANIPGLNIAEAVGAFDALGQQPQEVREQFIRNMGAKRLEASQEVIVKCLKIIAAAATIALNMMTQK
jgi:hypothetical protein